MSHDAFGLFGTPSPDDNAPDDDALDDNAPDIDISGANMFTEEIENINASDWNVDSDQLWGDGVAEETIDIGDGFFDTDFPI
ncbi:MAG TPA: hypothetical protein DIW46_01055 [Microbacterium sp.]|nr:hypothetical protein [Microbacterium sp.]